MREKVAAKRYAEGFAAYAKENIGLEKADAELTLFRQIITSQPEFKEFLENQEIEANEKFSVMDKAFKGVFTRQTLDFIGLLIKKGRVAEVGDIADSLRIIYHRERGMEKAVLKTACQTEPRLMTALKEKLEKKLGKKLELEPKIDPNLLGGAQALAGNIIIDGSIRKKLMELKENLLSIKVG